jgi:BirA family biotin operon repressor/biotin-[acetyl-CoA-carboxylase] ligase
MSAASLFMGKSTIHLDEIDSTNNFAQELISKTSPTEGTLILADYQTGGRGQIGRKWHSLKAHNILATYILKPEFLDIADQFLLNMAVSVGVYRTISTWLGEEVKIKWPNDIYVGDRKICGMLIQNFLRGSKINYSIIGLGININQQTFPAEIPNPTSLSIELAKDVDREEVISHLSSSLEQYYLLCRQTEKYKDIKEQYLSHLYRLNQFQDYRDSQGTIFTAKITDISREGKLILEDHSGIKSSYAFREIQYLWES